MSAAGPSGSGPLLAVSMGDPAGVGPEIALAARLSGKAPPFFVVGDPDWFADVSGRLKLGATRSIAEPDEARRLANDVLPVLPAPCRLARTPQFGEGDPENAPAVLSAIERAVSLTTTGQADAVTTMPINKAVLGASGFAHPGHTDFLGVLAARFWPGQSDVPVMMLASSLLRVVPVTVHVPLKVAIESLSVRRIVETGRIAAQALKRDFGLKRQRLAVAGLNPHAGENGLLGREEVEIVTPAVEELQGEGFDVFGPAPADTLFHEEARSHYDLALCMTHDQALIPLKTLDFHGGVNVTLGLPFVRTSPDHGTAFDLAGTGRARADSAVAALRMAAEMAERRRRSRIEDGNEGGGAV